LESPKFRLDLESVFVTALSLAYIVSLTGTVICLSSLKKGRVKLMACSLEGAPVTLKTRETSKNSLRLRL